MSDLCLGCWKCDPHYLGFRVCPMCGNKRCPKASDHTLVCTNSNEPGQPGSIYTREPDTSDDPEWTESLDYGDLRFASDPTHPWFKIDHRCTSTFAGRRCQQAHAERPVWHTYTSHLVVLRWWE